MEREKFTLAKKDATSILYGDDDNYSVIARDKEGDSRWAVEYRLVIKRLSDGKFFESGYRQGTGDEGERPWEYEKTVDFIEVFPEEKVVIIYK